MDEFSWPPERPAADETVVLDGPAFRAHSKMFEAMAVKLRGRIAEKVCSHSPEWGNVARAKIVFKHNHGVGTTCLTCWNQTGEAGVNTLASVEGCCGSQP